MRALEDGAFVAPEDCVVREVLDRVGDKWTVLVIHLLGAKPRRFSELKRGIDGISQRMLTVTLPISGRRRAGRPVVSRIGVSTSCRAAAHLRRPDVRPSCASKLTAC